MAYIDWKNYLGLEEIELTYRIDEDAARTEKWPISTDHTAAGKWSGGTAIPFIKSLLGHE